MLVVASGAKDTELPSTFLMLRKCNFCHFPTKLFRNLKTIGTVLDQRFLSASEANALLHISIFSTEVILLQINFESFFFSIQINFELWDSE